MTQRRSELEMRLVDLSELIDWPRSDLAPAVTQAIAGGERPGEGLRLPHWAAVVAAVMVVVTVLVATPTGRRAVGELLGVAGIEIEWGEAEVAVAGAALDLGRPVTLEEAAGLVDFPLLVPGSFGLGAPDGVYLSDVVFGGVTLVWQAGAGLPAAPGSGVGLLSTQFRADLDRGLLVKRLGAETRVEAVDVRGVRGFWIEGRPHVLLYRLPDGTVVEDSARLAANVLVWEELGVTHRLETALPLATTLHLAEGLTPFDDGS